MNGDPLDELDEQSEEITLLRAEIERLRLTAAERSAIADAADRYAAITPESAETAVTLRNLLDRIGHQDGSGQ